MRPHFGVENPFHCVTCLIDVGCGRAGPGVATPGIAGGVVLATVAAKVGRMGFTTTASAVGSGLHHDVMRGWVLSWRYRSLAII